MKSTKVLQSIQYTMSWLFSCQALTCFGQRDSDDNDGGSDESSWTWKSLLWTPQLSAQQLMRKWQREILKQKRLLDRAVREITRREISIKNDLSKAEKEKKTSLVTTYTKDLAQHEKAKKRTVESISRLTSFGMEIRRQGALVRVQRAFTASSEILSLLNGMVRMPELREMADQMSKSMLNAGLIDDVLEEVVAGNDEDESAASAAASSSTTKKDEAKAVDAALDEVIIDVYKNVANAPVVDDPIGDRELEEALDKLCSDSPGQQMEK